MKTRSDASAKMRGDGRSQGSSRAIEFEIQSTVQSLVEALHACDAFLSLRGIHDSRHFQQVFFRLVRGVLWGEDHGHGVPHVSVCVECLTGETFRISLREQGEQGTFVHVAHVSTVGDDQSDALAATLRAQWAEQPEARWPGPSVRPNKERGVE